MSEVAASVPAPGEPAEDAVELMLASTLPDEDAVVTVAPGAVGAHVGILYRKDDAGARNHLHLADHFRLQDDSGMPDDALWVEPSLDEDALADVRSSANLIARRHQDGRVPYAFRYADARFDEGGALQLNQSFGLTCATFVERVFAHARVALLDAETWERDRSEERKQEDVAAQGRLVRYLRTIDPKQAERVAAEVGCMRIRAEEVAATSGMGRHPITFVRAEPEGRRVLQAVWAPAPPEPDEEPAGATVVSPEPAVQT